MTTFLIVLLAVLGILAMLGAALAVSWLCGQAAGRAVGWALDVREPPPCDGGMAPQRLAELDALQERARRTAARAVEQAQARERLQAWELASQRKRALAQGQ